MTSKIVELNYIPVYYFEHKIYICYDCEKIFSMMYDDQKSFCIHKKSIKYLGKLNQIHSSTRIIKHSKDPDLYEEILLRIL